MNKVDQLGLHLQKFGAGLKLMASQISKTSQQVAVLLCAVDVLYDKGLITIDEVRGKIDERENTEQRDTNVSKEG